MPRGQHVGLIRSNAEINESLENALKYHIVAVRRRKDGAITSVKHVEWGWLKIGDYYKIQKVDELMPLVATFIEGGFRLKAALWSFEIPFEALATGAGIPMGVILVIIAITLSLADAAAGHTLYAALDLFSLFLPFGELWLLYRGLDIFWSLVKGAGAASNDVAALIGLPPSPLNPLLFLFGGTATLVELGILKKTLESNSTTGGPTAFIEASWEALAKIVVL